MFPLKRLLRLVLAHFLLPLTGLNDVALLQTLVPVLEHVALRLQLPQRFGQLVGQLELHVRFFELELAQPVRLVQLVILALLPTLLALLRNLGLTPELRLDSRDPVDLVGENALRFTHLGCALNALLFELTSTLLFRFAVFRAHRRVRLTAPSSIVTCTFVALRFVGGRVVVESLRHLGDHVFLGGHSLPRRKHLRQNPIDVLLLFQPLLFDQKSLVEQFLMGIGGRVVRRSRVGRLDRWKQGGLLVAVRRDVRPPFLRVLGDVGLELGVEARVRLLLFIGPDVSEPREIRVTVGLLGLARDTPEALCDSLFVALGQTLLLDAPHGCRFSFFGVADSSRLGRRSNFGARFEVQVTRELTIAPLSL
uniref:Putative secreted protein n=1 Tax=Ixodes ricinus TaxID=34613 RepID=A0A6B0V9C1_IXORI